MNLSWQSFIILNLIGIIGLAFWLGNYVGALKRLVRDQMEFERCLSEYRKDHSSELQRMRSAYHNMAGFLQALHPEFKGMDIDKPR